MSDAPITDEPLGADEDETPHPDEDAAPRDQFSGESLGVGRVPPPPD